jgi:hypothetical protein
MSVKKESDINLAIQVKPNPKILVELSRPDPNS